MTTHPSMQPGPTNVGPQPAPGTIIDVVMKGAPPLPHPDKAFRQRTQDSFAERPLRGAGSLAGEEVIACQKYPGDIRRQIMSLCEPDFPSATGWSRSLGFERKAAIRRGLHRFVDMLDECAEQSGDPSLRLRNTDEFCERHLLAILGCFARKKIALSTIHTELSSLRKFMTLLGRRHLVPRIDELMYLTLEHDIDLDLGRRSHISFVPIAWSAIVNVDGVMQIIKHVNEHAHMLTELCIEFGLRETEVVRFCPVESDRGNHIWVRRGPKGNRERLVPLSDDPQRRQKQRSLLDRAKVACGGDPERHLGFGDRTLEQARKYYETVLNECGVTLRQLGIKLHGGRHEFAARRFFELTGLPAPVLRQAPFSAYQSRMALVRHAEEQIASELGHRRVDVVRAYIGSLSTLRQEEKQAQLAGKIIGKHRAELQTMGVAAVTVAVRKIADQKHTRTLYVELAGAGEITGHDDSLVARLRKCAGVWLGQKINVLVAPPPAQAGMVIVAVKHA